MAEKLKSPADYIEPLNLNGLTGRMLQMPPPKGAAEDREVLFIYGQHALLERWWGVMLILNRYMGVTMPDLPGFGGMDSFYKIGKEPTIDNLADYLADFIKQHCQRKRLVLAGLSLGFVVVTRMLQRHPELTERVDMLVSFVGFAHKDDFVFDKRRYWLYRLGSGFFAQYLPSQVFRHVFLQPVWLRRAYHHSPNAKQKFDGKAGEDFDATMDMEIKLWQLNDIRTQMRTNVEMFTLDNCQQRVDLPVWHVGIANDRYFDNRVVARHMEEIFSEFHAVPSKGDNHAPSVIADEKVAAPFIPPSLRRKLEEFRSA